MFGAVTLTPLKTVKKKKIPLAKCILIFFNAYENIFCIILRIFSQKLADIT